MEAEKLLSLLKRKERKRKKSPPSADPTPRALRGEGLESDATTYCSQFL